MTPHANPLADGIRKHGFRKWYERELLQGHAHLVLLIFCALGILGAFEAASRFTGWADRLVDAAALLVCIVVGVWALRRYLYLLAHAETVANQADCPQCGTYARFTLRRATTEGACVACRQCGHEWEISG